jgi:tight adherence protein C
METLLKSIAQQGNTLFLGAVFLSAILFTVALVNLTTTWFGVRRRATSSMGLAAGGSAHPHQLVRDAKDKSILDAFLMRDEKSKSELRKFLNLAGYYGAQTPFWYQVIRIVSGLVFGLTTPTWADKVWPNLPFPLLLLLTAFVALLGFMLPRSIVSLQRDKLLEEHRNGFPDLLDLLVICVEAGIGMDSAIDRVGTDLKRSYPSLSTNLRFMSLEMRAGRSTREALGNLADRLGIGEARSFAMLVQQSEELGSSLVQSLRVYSDEMRSKRLSRAEEKAHALPAKLVIPLGLFIFPVLLGVTVFPIAIKILKALDNW